MEHKKWSFLPYNITHLWPFAFEQKRKRYMLLLLIIWHKHKVQTLWIHVSTHKQKDGDSKMHKEHETKNIEKA